MKYRISQYYWLYVIISVAAIVYNLYTLPNHVPWVDEVMICDTPANYYLYGIWETRAYYGAYKASVYMPLYGLLSLGWYHIMGFSFISGRLLNIILYFVLGILLLKILRNIIGKSPSLVSVVFVTILYWFTYDLAMLYREGRPDVLCAFLSAIVFLITIKDIQRKETLYFLHVVLAILVVMCGLQAFVYIVWIELLLLVFYWEQRRTILKIIFSLFTGGFIGGCATLLFMYKTGVLNEFVINNLSMSSTLWKIFLFVVPYISDKQFGAVSDSPINLFTKLQESWSQLLIIMYFFAIMMALISYFVKREFNKTTCLLIIAPLYTLFVMTVSGRYYGHYSWMVYLPMMVFFLYILNIFKSQLNTWLYFFMLIIVVGKSIPSFGKINDVGYKNLSEFIHRQSFRPTDRVASPMAPFYELKPLVKDCYFTEIYPCDKLPHIDYFIMPVHYEKSDKLMNYYKGVKNMELYFDRICQDTTVHVSLVDTCSYPSLELYRIEWGE